MITYVAGSLFSSPAQVLVNTVNIEGVMGKGIALEFKKTFPEMFTQYQALCEKGKIDIGTLWIYKTDHKWVLNFPTKKSWRSPSKPEYIEAGLRRLVEEFNDLKIYSIAFPALGCGNGELDWVTTVKPLMESYLRAVPADIFIHPPLAAEDIPEHRNQAEIKEWLRSQPHTLSFNEVWSDLKEMLPRKPKFRTATKSFTARIIDENKDRYLVIATESRLYKIEYEDLREVWSRFRSHGYLRRGIVSRVIEKILSYIMPIFAELDYVERVELSETGDFSRNLIGKKTVTGLQYVAPIETTRQPELFF